MTRSIPIMMTATATAAIAAALALGCGGGQRAATPPSGGGGASEAERAEPAGGAMVPPEKMDEINRLLERKRPIVSRCLATAIDNKELPKNSRGKVTLEIVISPAGKADSVKIVRTTLESKILTDCVISRIQEMAFPELPRSYETSYTYGFEAM